MVRMKHAGAHRTRILLYAGRATNMCREGARRGGVEREAVRPERVFQSAHAASVAGPAAARRHRRTDRFGFVP